ncbi:MAG TPA: branched-chain amino acid ABC transporter permease [Smithellaceae bacterium]|jgi:branched-chain amino acid transport system permease protein|nr:MAG: High-affinity branched-chain amino acid transport system permease protein LivH [Deltaproteobacteria bacterium ADurb.BinA014]HNQ17820.1 branched-chain amino acid ABC transporter permease [Smithellaceae bacterium]HNT90401.1 branched-chain amino acid ABC transporter permease [Smithellaceae bacterium]HNV63755.1 branched-chain amino acid ABC transporter permease [Smithellaceae bacterium]HNZ30607.1 branched-chain amino acid ABC transporter permease [Smithellaceae bacterium]
MTKEKRQIIIFLIFSFALLVIPFSLRESYLLNVMVFIGIHTMLAVALNLLMGYAGQISLGHAAFFGMGAYISGIFTTRFGLDPWLVIIMAALCAAAIAFAMGFPILKLKGHYLAMATLGFGIIIYIIFNETVNWTGGPSGLSGIPNLKIGELVFDNDFHNYYLVWIITLGVMLLSINLSQSRIGRALRAVHDSEVAARVMGINAWVLKVQIFTVSAFISAMAGSLYAHTMTFVAPASFGFNFSVELVTMVVVGGLGSIYGSFLGAAILTTLPEFLRVFEDFDIIIYGLMLIVITMFMPGGLISGLQLLSQKFFLKFKAKADKGA